jgi:hypothetical protein
LPCALARLAWSNRWAAFLDSSSARLASCANVGIVALVDRHTIRANRELFMGAS